MVTERKVLSVVGFDVGFPLSYRSEPYHCIMNHSVIFNFLTKFFTLKLAFFQIPETIRPSLSHQYAYPDARTVR